MKYPFSKQIIKVYELNNEKEIAFKAKTILIQSLIIYVKILLIIFSAILIIDIFNSIKLNILYSNFNIDNIIERSNILLNDIDELIYKISSIEFSDKSLLQNIFSNIIDLLNDLKVKINSAISTLVNAPTEPITSETLNIYMSAANTFYRLSTYTSLIATILGAIPFGVDFEIALSGIAEELFTLGDMVISKYNNSILPIIESTQDKWMNLVYPISSLIESLIILISTFTGIAFLVPLILGNGEGFMGLPVYFWLSFSLSIILIFAMLFINLIKISSNKNGNERNGNIKNSVFGLALTLTSFIIIPIIFGVTILFFALIIESLFGISLLSGSHLSSNSLSLLLIGNSTEGGASFLGDTSSPFGYLNGEVILLTTNYFNYTFYSIFSILITCLLFALLILIIIKVFNIIQYLIIGPIVMMMYMKDGMIVFSTWTRNLFKIFFEFTIIILQILILVEIANVFNTSLNDIISGDPKILIIIFTILLAATIFAIFSMFSNVTNIFFKDNRVKAEIDKKSFEGVNIDTNIKNKSLNVNDEKLSKTIKKTSQKSQKINTNNLKNVSKKLNSEKIKENSKNTIKEKMENKFDIEAHHINDSSLIKDIDYIVLDKTPAFEVIEDIELNYIMEINDVFLSSTTWSIPLSNSDFNFEWSINESDIITEVPLNIEMSVSASDSSSRISGSDSYEFVLLEDNLYNQPIENNFIYKALGLVLITIVILGLVSWFISSIFKGGK